MKKSLASLAPQYAEHDATFLRLGSQPMRVALIYSPLPGQESDASDLGQVIGNPAVSRHSCMAAEIGALQSLGHEVSALAISYRNLHLLKQLQVDFVFNYCEGSGVDGDPGLEVVLALEKRLLPFAGVGAGPYALSMDKAEMKSVLDAAGVPTPAGRAHFHPEQELAPGLRFPLFVKPRFGFGSEGIDEKSRVSRRTACRAAIERIIGLTGLDALVEEFIPGREITVGVIGNASELVMLPPLEVHFGEAYAGKPNIRTYQTKRDTSSSLYWGFRTQCPAGLKPDAERRVIETAAAAYCAIGGDGFGRVDIRLAEDGTPYVIEVNCNCSLEEAPDEHDCGMMPLMAHALGWGFPGLLARIIGAGLRRPLKRYQAPKLGLRREDDRIFGHALTNLRKGVRVAGLGPAESNDEGQPAWLDQLLLRPQFRLLAHSDFPNLGITRHNGAYVLVTTRSVKEGEELTLNRADNSICTNFKYA